MRIQQLFNPTLSNPSQAGGPAGLAYGALQAAPKFYGQMEQAKFMQPMLQQQLAEKTGIAQTATGIGQQEIAKGQLAQKMVQAQLGLAQQHQQLVAQHAQQAAVATNVAQQTAQAHIAGQKALAGQQQQKAVLEKEIAQKYPNLTNAQIIQMAAAMQGVLLNHYAQRVAGAAQPAQNATTSVLAGATNTGSSGGNSPSGFSPNKHRSEDLFPPKNTGGGNRSGAPSPYHLTQKEVDLLPTIMYQGRLVHFDKKTGLHYPI